MSRNASHIGHRGSATARMPAPVIPARRHGHGVTPAPAMRDCLHCGKPFFSRSAANVVCVICRSESTAKFEGGL